MIGKAKWFKRRKYGGWGVAPKTWQGWAYLAVFIGLALLIQILPFGTEQHKMIATMILAGLVVIDVIHIMIHLPMDERDRLHEATAERNALWVMLAILIAGAGYQAATSLVGPNPQIDPVIIIAIFGALIAKAITNIYLDRKN